jgi:ligand-binding sensor domain-containing protein
VNFNKTNIGLPTNWFNDVGIQDGYIKWFASEGGGLIRFINATDLTVYNTGNSSIPSDNVRSLTVLGNDIWMATDKGAACLKEGVFTVYNLSNSPIPDSVDCVYPGPGGKIWVGSVHQGVFYFNGASWTRYHMGNSPLMTNKIRSLFVDQSSGFVWIGTLGEGLYVFDGSHWTKIFNALPSPKVDAIKLYGSEVWVGTSFHTRMVWNGIKFTPKYIPGGLAWYTYTWQKFKEAGSDIVALARDESGNLWFSDFNTSLGKKTAEGITRYTGYNKITGIAIDGSGHKWLSTSERGIVKYKGN